MEAAAKKAMKTLTVNIDDAIKHSKLGVKRAYCFMGFGVNAANNPDLNEIHLPYPPYFYVVPEDLNQESVDNIKRNFALWVVWNCLREMIESYGILLNGVYNALLMFDIKQSTINFDTIQEQVAAFSQLGEIKKLTKLKRELKFASPFEKHLKSFVDARNCITQGQGRITQNRCNDEDEFILLWRRLNPELHYEDGTVDILEPAWDFGQNPIVTKTGASFCIRAIDACLRFPVGATLNIPPAVLREICFAMVFEIDEVQRLFIERCGKGVVKKVSSGAAFIQ